MPAPDATGLIYLRARALDPSLGRFLSADSVIPNAPGSQGYNLYAYVANNPTTRVDPSGLGVGDGVQGIGGEVAAEAASWYLLANWALIALELAAGFMQAGGAGAIAMFLIVVFATVGCVLLGPRGAWVYDALQTVRHYARRPGQRRCERTGRHVP